MNQLQIFRNNGWTVRVIEQNGEPWFVARDVCAVLDIGNTSMAITRLDDDEFTSTEVIDSLNRKQQTYIVSEAGLYSLILGSRKPDAKIFKRWVTHEVIPSIRRTGSYSVKPKSGAELLVEMAQQLLNQERLLIQQQAQIGELKIQMQVTSHRIDSLDNVDVIGDKQQRLNAMIRKYAHQHGVTFEKAYKDFTAAFNTAFNTNLTARIENYKEKHGLKSLSRPQYLSMVDQLEDAIRVTDKMLNLVGV